MLVGGRDQVLAVTPSLRPDWLTGLHQLNRGRSGQGASVILLDPASFSQAQPAEGPAPPAAGEASAKEAPPKAPPHSSGAELFASLLARQGIHCSVVQRGELRPIAGAYGELSRWEFKTLGTGRVLVRNAPRQARSDAQ